ncbi:MAG: glycerol-3-phosphate acyltransferase [Actinomycetota bacterium]
MDFVWLLVPASFLLGTFPSALLIGRLVGRDPIEEGSGNPGATNMFRIAGKRAGIATLVFDVCKALGATLAGRFIEDTTFGVLCGCAAVLGHMFPIVRASRGGKGVACFGGLTIGAWPILAVIGFGAWIAGARLASRSFIGAMVGVPTIVIGTIVIGRPITEILAVAAVGAVIISRHHTNIRGLLAERG